jgi:hypothetical protein
LSAVERDPFEFPLAKPRARQKFAPLTEKTGTVVNEPTGISSEERKHRNIESESEMHISSTQRRERARERARETKVSGVSSTERERERERERESKTTYW